MMYKFIFLFFSIFTLISCGSETSDAAVNEGKEHQSKPESANDDARIEAVEINNILTLSQAQVFVLVDTLLKLDIDSMQNMLNEIQMEILSVQQIVMEVSTELEASEAFKEAVLDQILYVNESLQKQIPEMILKALSGDKELETQADEMYLAFVDGFGKKSENVLKNQGLFVKKHNIRFE